MTDLSDSPEDDMEMNTKLSAIFNDIMLPSTFFLKTVEERKIQYLDNSKVGLRRLYPTSVQWWMTKSIPRQVIGILIMLVFGVMAPPVGFIILMNIIVETLNWQLSIGRFILRESLVTFENSTDISTKHVYAPQIISLTSKQRSRVLKELESEAEPWGAYAAITHMQKQCKNIPLDILAIARPLYIIIPSITASFVANDIYRSDREYYKAGSGDMWAPAVILFTPVGCQLLKYCWKYYKREKGVDSKNNSHSDDDDDDDDSPGEITGAGSAEHLQSHHELEMTEILPSSVLSDTMVTFNPMTTNKTVL